MARRYQGDRHQLPGQRPTFETPSKWQTAPADQAKCRNCIRWYAPTEALERFADMADDPLLVEKVIRKLAAEYGPQIHKSICGECALTLADRAREATEWRGDQGYFILSDTEQRYGRTSEEHQSVALRRKKARVEVPAVQSMPVSAPQAANPVWASTQAIVPDEEISTVTNDEFPAYGNEVAPDENSAQPVETTEAPAEETIAPVVEEAKPASIVTGATAGLAEEFPVGTLVQVVTKGSEYVNQQGRVTGIVDKRGVNYLEVQLEVAASGVRKTKPRTGTMRGASVIKIGEYRDAPEAGPRQSQPAPQPEGDTTPEG